MPSLSPSQIFSLVAAAILVWFCVNILISAALLKRTAQLRPSRYLFPARCKADKCLDPAGYIRFIMPRLLIFAALGLLMAAFLVVNVMTDLTASLPLWFQSRIELFLFLPLFVWYVVFINKAAKRFW